MNSLTNALQSAANFALVSADNTLTAFGKSLGNIELQDKIAKLFKAVFQNLAFDLELFGFNPHLVFVAKTLEKHFTTIELYTKSSNIISRADDWINWKLSGKSIWKQAKIVALTFGHILDCAMGLDKLKIIPLAQWSAKFGNVVSYYAPALSPIAYMPVAIAKDIWIAGASLCSLKSWWDESSAIKTKLAKEQKWQKKLDNVNNINGHALRHYFLSKKDNTAGLTQGKQDRLTEKANWGHDRDVQYLQYKIGIHAAAKPQLEQDLTKLNRGALYDSTKILIIAGGFFAATVAPNYIVPGSMKFFKDGVQLSTALMRFGAFVNLFGFMKALVEHVHEREPLPRYNVPQFYADLPKA